MDGHVIRRGWEFWRFDPAQLLPYEQGNQARGTIVLKLSDFIELASSTPDDTAESGND